MSESQNGEVNSLLTSTQREYLRGELDIETGSAHERVIRSRIRNRVRAGLTDLVLLRRRLDANDRQTVFRSPDDEAAGVNLTVGVLPDAVAFLYLGLADQYADAEQVEREFANIVRNGVLAATAQQGVTVEDVNVSIEVERGEPLPNPREQSLAQMEVAVLQQLLTTDQITPGEFADEIQRRKQQGSDGDGES